MNGLFILKKPVLIMAAVLGLSVFVFISIRNYVAESDFMVWVDQQEALEEAAFTNNVDVLNRLISNGIEPDLYDGVTLVHIAALGNSVNVMQWLANAGYDIQAADHDGLTPMHFAALENSIDALDWLKANGAEINVRDLSGGTPLHAAVLTNAVRAIEWFRENGANLNARNSIGATPLDLAISEQLPEVINLLQITGN